MHKSLHVAVVGGGITGLATAYFLLQGSDGIRPRVTLIEADHRLGGKIRTEPFASIPVDAGPDAFLARVPWAVDLCKRLDLDKDLVAPATGKTWLWTRGRLRPLPGDLVMGVPTGPVSVARAGILSPLGLARAGLDLVLPFQNYPPDPSIARVIGARLGHEVVERLVEPLLGGIYAGRADSLSIAAVAPHLAVAAKKHRSLILGLRKERQPQTAGGASPAFLTIPGGLESLVNRLHDVLRETNVQPGTQVETVMRQPGGRYLLACKNGSAVIADGVVLTAPAWSAANILRDIAPAAAVDLEAIEYSSVIVVTLGYAPSAFPGPLNGSGFLVPRIDGRLLTACSWATSKWPHLERSGLVILRCSTGRLGDDRAWQLDDKELVRRIHNELVEAMGVRSNPVAARITRWERTFPQYDEGHQARVTRIEAALNDLPGLMLAGAAYRGVGIPACIHDGEQAAARMLAYLGNAGSTPMVTVGE